METFEVESGHRVVVKGCVNKPSSIFLHSDRFASTGRLYLYHYYYYCCVVKMPSGTRVYVGNLASDTRERDVEKFFKGYGRIREVALKNGYGFVEFDDDRDADDAVHDLDGKQLLGMRSDWKKRSIYCHL